MTATSDKSSQTGLPIRFCEGTVHYFGFDIESGSLAMIVQDYHLPFNQAKYRGKHKLDFRSVVEIRLSYADEGHALSELGADGIVELEPGTEGLRRFAIHWEGRVMHIACRSFVFAKVDDSATVVAD